MSSEADIVRKAFEAAFAGRTGPLVECARQGLLSDAYAREQLAFYIEQSRIQEKPGRKPQPRDKYGATPREAQLCASYETYHGLIESGVSSKEAEAEARRSCEMTDEQFLELVRSGNSRINPYLRKRKTLRSKGSGVANISGAISAA